MTAVPVEIAHLTKTFGQRRAVDNLCLTVPEGQVVGFLGPNGAGKTTTIRCLLGLYRPTHGSVRVFGANPEREPAAVLSNVGYLPGELRLPDNLTGRYVLDRFGGIRHLTDTSYRDQLVDRFGVELDRPIGTLSKGNKQKIGLVLAVMHRPRLVVLDEPTSGLDPLLQDEFATLLRETIDDGRTVLLSSHDLDETQRVVQRVALVKAGKLIIDDTVDALRARAPRTISAEFDHDVDAGPLSHVPGVNLQAATGRRLTLTHTGPAGPVLSVLAALAPETISARAADLEEIFLRHYQKDPDER